MSEYLILFGSALTFGFPYLLQALKLIGPYSVSRYKAIILTNDQDSDKLVGSLTSETTIVVNIDKEIKATFTNDESKQVPVKFGDHVMSILSPAYYSKGKEVLKNIVSMLKNKQLILISKDYQLVKFLCDSRVDCLYLGPTDLYRQFLGISQDDPIFCASMSLMKKYKSDKLQVYSVYQDLENMVMSRYPCLTRKF
jgi:hypothetical protein